MSFLTPLYALGFLALAAPIYFHLVRRRPKGEVPFSSLMFLTPSPPPPSQKRRLEQLLLLLFRASVLLLLGFAFMRPFLREEASAQTAGVGQRVILLIDTSASMRRGDLWARAMAEAKDVLDKNPSDLVSIFAFDRAVRPVLGFDEIESLEPTQRIAVARDRLAKLTPTWANTDMGHAILDSVGKLREASDARAAKGGKLVLVTDLQQGAKLAGLEGFDWPADVELDLHTITDGGGNAGLDLLVDRVETDAAKATDLRVRVANDANSKPERFTLTWDGSTDAIEAYVPPGESRVVKVPRPATNRTDAILRLRGDAHEFDNALHFATPKQEELHVRYLGSDDPKDAAKLRYFLDRAWSETPDRKVIVDGVNPDEKLGDLRTVPLMVLNGEASEANTTAISRYLQDGGTVLALITAPGPVGTLAKLAGVEPLTAAEAKLGRYAMLQEIAFDHPLFAPLAGPQFGDFTKVHVWKHREIDIPGARVLARFDNGAPAVLEKTIGRGRLIVFTFGWHPADSELSRSTKFVPLMTSLLDLRYGRRPESVNHHVGDRLPLPASSAGAITVRKPDGTSVTLPAGAATFDQTDMPGVFLLETAAGIRPVAVNLDAAESLTSPIAVESLEQLGVKFAKRTTEAERAAHAQQLRDVELEKNQSIWRALILAAIMVLMAETALAGRRNRRATT